MVRRRKVSPAARIFIRKNRAVIFGQPYFFVMGMGYLKNRGTQFLTFHFVYVILSSNCAFGLGLCAQRQELRNKDWRDCDEKNSDLRNKKSVRDGKEGWMRRVSDFLPVRMQDKLRYRKPEVRKEERAVKYCKKGCHIYLRQLFFCVRGKMGCA